MDLKQLQLLTGLQARVVAGEFGESDVLALLILLREDAPIGGPLRELTDFVAHRKRDRGPLRDYMLEVRRRVDAPGTQTLRIAIVYTEDEIAAALNAALAAHALAPLSQQRGRQVQATLLSMLQRVAMLDEKGQQFGELQLVVSPDAFTLVGVVTFTSSNLGARLAFEALAVTNECDLIGPGVMVSPRREEALLTVIVRGGVAAVTQRTVD